MHLKQRIRVIGLGSWTRSASFLVYLPQHCFLRAQPHLMHALLLGAAKVHRCPKLNGEIADVRESLPVFRCRSESNCVSNASIKTLTATSHQKIRKGLASFGEKVCGDQRYVKYELKNIYVSQR